VVRLSARGGRAKALGNGVPVGACWARPEVAKAFRPGDHGSTFGGQPFAMAVAQATLGRLRSIDAPGIAARLGPRLARSFAGIDGVASVRGAGFLLGAVLEDGIDSRAVFGEALAAGLVVNAPVPGVVRLMPPFIVTEADCDEAVALLGVAIGRAGASARKSTGERG
jgi:acetylornithine/succinyldiaminopimelate/putrescine aminotransferase